MPCFQQNSQPAPSTGLANVGVGSFATEADCLNACKEGACCNGTTCSVKPQCQCNAAAGEVFKGVGTVCSPNPCFPCGCGPSELQLITVQSGEAQTFPFFPSSVTQEMLGAVASVLANKTFVLAYFGPTTIGNGYTDNLSLYRAKTPSGGIFLGTQDQINSLSVGDVLWQGVATCPTLGSTVVTDVWAKISFSGIDYLVKWGTRGLQYSSCVGGSHAATSFTGSVTRAASIGGDVKLFTATASYALASNPLP
jgi:hypothetical protein